jgi:Domain of unknown function (DUF4387)
VPKLRDVCSKVRSKNAGPFWITVDLFFVDEAAYRRYRDDRAIGAAAFGALYGVDPACVKRFEVDRLNVVKVSYPRPAPQGGVVERDMHAGQQFADLLDVELSGNGAASAEVVVA